MTEAEYILVASLERLRAAEHLLNGAYLKSLFPGEQAEIAAVLGKIEEWRERLEKRAVDAVVEPSP